MMTNTLVDGMDVQCEICSLFTRTNVLVRQFAKCSTDVKVTLINAYCVCLYDVDLWIRYISGLLDKLVS